MKHMAMSKRESNQRMPIVMRWKERVSDGLRHWTVASIRDDATFWGYVHIRTDAISENRSFDGRLSKSKHDRIRSLVESLNVLDVELKSHDAVDGLIGLGSRSNFKTIVIYNPQSSDLPHADLFCEIVDILQPDVIDAA